MGIMWLNAVIVLLLCGELYAFRPVRVGGRIEETTGAALVGRRWHRVYAVENEPTKVGSTGTATSPKRVTKAKAKEPEPNIVMYNKYDNVPQWKLSDSFNSTTLKLIFDFRVSDEDPPVVALAFLIPPLLMPLFIHAGPTEQRVGQGGADIRQLGGGRHI
jgi:hypothetical protein